MKLGRDFTNMLNQDFLTPDQREDLRTGRCTVADLDATVQILAKKDIVHQIRRASELGQEHIELDGGVPNPYLDLDDATLFAARETARMYGLTLSLHLPYTFVATAITSFQEADRRAAVDLLKRYLDVAKKLGCIHCNMHPGNVPYYQTMGAYREQVRRKIVESLTELCRHASACGILLHLENNTAPEEILAEVDECAEVLRRVTDNGAEIRYCFDIGHWFTRASLGKEVPEPPEKVMEQMPEKFMAQLHLNDYLVEGKVYHPPLHRQQGFLKRKNLVNYFRIARQKGATIVIVETAVRAAEDLLRAPVLLKEEQAYLLDVMEEAGVRASPRPRAPVRA